MVPGLPAVPPRRVALSSTERAETTSASQGFLVKCPAPLWSCLLFVFLCVAVRCAWGLAGGRWGGLQLAAAPWAPGLGHRNPCEAPCCICPRFPWGPCSWWQQGQDRGVPVPEGAREESPARAVAACPWEQRLRGWGGTPQGGGQTGSNFAAFIKEHTITTIIVSLASFNSISEPVAPRVLHLPLPTILR